VSNQETEKIEIQIFQDGMDIKNGMLQFLLNEGSKTCYVYFTLDEWRVFKEYVNKFRYTFDIRKHPNEDYMIKNNPLTVLCQDGSAIQVCFGGNLAFDLYIENHKGNSALKQWKGIKKIINDFEPETSSVHAPATEAPR
jgi:hypothetical protein